QAVNARDLPGRVAATARPGGLTARRPTFEGRVAATRPHEDTAQSSGYVVLAGWSIEPGYNSATAPKTLNSTERTLNAAPVFLPPRRTRAHAACASTEVRSWTAVQDRTSVLLTRCRVEAGGGMG